MDLLSFAMGAKSAGSDGTGTTDYNALQHKPKIDGVELFGNRTAAELGLAVATDTSAHFTDQNNPHGVTVEQIGAVPTSRTINGQSLTEDLTLTIPSRTSELTNDAGFLNAHQDISGKADKTTTEESIAQINSSLQTIAAKLTSIDNRLQALETWHTDYETEFSDRYILTMPKS